MCKHVYCTHTHLVIYHAKHYALTEAFQVVVQPVNEHQFSLGLAPLSVAVQGAEKGLHAAADLSQVLGIYEPTEALRETYQRMTAAIITPPSRPVLVRS